MFAKSHHRSFPPSLRHKGQIFWSPRSAWLATLLCLLRSVRYCDLIRACLGKESKACLRRAT